MSVIECSDCGQFIDSDDDPGCFVEVTYSPRQGLTVDTDAILCEQCRDEWGDDLWHELIRRAERRCGQDEQVTEGGING